MNDTADSSANAANKRTKCLHAGCVCECVKCLVVVVFQNFNKQLYCLLGGIIYFKLHSTCSMWNKMQQIL